MFTRKTKNIFSGSKGPIKTNNWSPSTTSTPVSVPLPGSGSSNSVSKTGTRLIVPVRSRHRGNGIVTNNLSDTWSRDHLKVRQNNLSGPSEPASRSLKPVFKSVSPHNIAPHRTPSPGSRDYHVVVPRGRTTRRSEPTPGYVNLEPSPVGMCRGSGSQMKVIQRNRRFGGSLRFRRSDSLHLAHPTVPHTDDNDITRDMVVTSSPDDDVTLPSSLRQATLAKLKCDREVLTRKFNDLNNRFTNYEKHLTVQSRSCGRTDPISRSCGRPEPISRASSATTRALHRTVLSVSPTQHYDAPTDDSDVTMYHPDITRDDNDLETCLDDTLQSTESDDQYNTALEDQEEEKEDSVSKYHRGIRVSFKLSNPPDIIIS